MCDRALRLPFGSLGPSERGKHAHTHLQCARLGGVAVVQRQHQRCHPERWADATGKNESDLPLEVPLAKACEAAVLGGELIAHEHSKQNQIPDKADGAEGDADDGMWAGPAGGRTLHLRTVMGVEAGVDEWGECGP